MRILAVCFSMILGAGAAPASPADTTTVNTEGVPVYSEPSALSAVLQKLSKGAAVAIEYIVTTGEDEWCSLSSPARGYVLCGYLKRDRTLQPDAGDAPMPPVLTPPPAVHAPA